MNQKTKKIFLLTSTILALLVDITSIIALYSGAINLETIGDSVQISNNSQLVILCICALVNLIGTIFITKNFIGNKKKLIFFNVVQLLLGNIVNIISGIINIFLLSTKTKDVEEDIKEKKELPILEDITKYKWYVYLIIFIFLFVICYTPLTNLLPAPKTKITALISVISLYLLQVVLLVIPMANELKRDFIVFKNNFKLYLAKMLPRFGVIMIVYFICNFSLMLFIDNIPTNQAILNDLPIYITAILAIIIAPLIEELMFRGFIKKFVQNNFLFIILSSLIFGGLHIAVADSLKQILFIIPYSILGFAFSLNYVKTRNIASNIFLHSAWNSIAILAMILVEFL